MTNRRVSGSCYPYVSDLQQVGEVSGQAVHPLPATGTGPSTIGPVFAGLNLPYCLRYPLIQQN